MKTQPQLLPQSRVYTSMIQPAPHPLSPGGRSRSSPALPPAQGVVHAFDTVNGRDRSQALPVHSGTRSQKHSLPLPMKSSAKLEQWYWSCSSNLEDAELHVFQVSSAGGIDALRKDLACTAHVGFSFMT